MSLRLLALALLLCVAAAGLGSAQDAPADSEDLLERIKRLEEQVERLQGRDPGQPAPSAAPAAPAAGPKSQTEAEAEAESEWRLPADQAAQQPTKTAGSYDKVEDWRHPYGFVDDGKHPVLELPQGMKLKLWGELRSRGEFRDPADFRIPGQAGRPASEDQRDTTDFALLRTRVGLDFKVHPNLRAVVELQDSRIWGDTTPGSDANAIYVRQAFAELSEPLELPLWLWVGRWDVPELGDGRLVSPLYFANVTRSWDGVQLFGHFGGSAAEPWAWLTAFSANVREGAVFSTNEDQDDFWFSGVYLSLRGWDAHEFDFYLFHRHFSDDVFLSETRPGLDTREDFTLGTRSAHDYGFAGYTTEIAWQAGNLAGDRLRAWAGAVTGWLKFDLGEERSLKVTGEYAYASGDKDPTDGKQQRFDPLVPRNYRHHGSMNLVAWSNIHALSLESGFTLLPGLVFTSKVHAFWLDKTKDGWFEPVDGLVRRDPTGRARSFLGNELDLSLTWTLFDDHLQLRASYSHFWAGSFVRDTGRSSPGRSSGGMDFAYLEMTLGF